MPAPYLRSVVRSGGDRLLPVWVVHSPFSPGRGPSVAGRPSCFRLCPDGVGGGACRPLAHDWLGREGGLVAVFLDGQPPGF